MDVARVRLLFSFRYSGIVYPCALVHWFQSVSNTPDEDTGMWIVKPAYIRSRRSSPILSVIHLNTIVRAAHLIGVSLGATTPETAGSHESLDTFESFYVNKFVDHHAFDMLHFV